MEPTLDMLSAGGFRGRLRWLVRLRWIAIVGVAAAILFSSVVLRVSLPLVPLAVGTALLLLLNIAYAIVQRRTMRSPEDEHSYRRGRRFAHVQISADLALLAYFIHYTGGAENPLVLFFVLHMVIASILLPRRSAYLQAGIAVAMLGIVFAGELGGWLAHHHLDRFIPVDCLVQPVYVGGVFMVLTVTVFIAVYLATSIMDELRVGEKELAAANQALKQQDRIKSQYVLRVSHDIKSSLATIQACVQVVVAGLAGPLTERGRDILGRAERRSRNLLVFVRDLLDLSKIRASATLDVGETQVLPAVRAALDQVRSTATEKGIRLIEPALQEYSVIATTASLEEVLLNLVGDCVKYTQPGGEVRITVADDLDRDVVEVTVSDTGIGIDKDDLPFIFDDFYRAENAQRLEKDGSGLGLSIAKQIVNSIGGQIWAESEKGEGTEFHLLLPRARERR